MSYFCSSASCPHQSPHMVACFCCPCLVSHPFSQTSFICHISAGVILLSITLLFIFNLPLFWWLVLKCAWIGRKVWERGGGEPRRREEGDLGEGRRGIWEREGGNCLSEGLDFHSLNQNQEGFRKPSFLLLGWRWDKCNIKLATHYLLHTTCYILHAILYMLHTIQYAIHATCYTLHTIDYTICTTTTCYVLHTS